MSKLIAILKNERMQNLLKAMKDGKLKVIEPVVKFNGGIKYAKLEKFFDSPEDAKAALIVLSETGLLTWDIVDNVVVCPRCQSHKLLLRSRCPSCGSPKLIRGAMIEHLSCGHIDFEERFKGEEGLICPQCKKPLDTLGVDYRTYSFLYRCMNCGGVFTTPKIEYLCDKGHEFDEREMAIQSIKAYRLNPKKEDLLKRVTISLEKIFQPILKGGWHVELPAKVNGATGAEHEFSFALWSGKDGGKGKTPPDIVGTMHMSDQDATATDVLAFWAKAVDARAKHRVMMTLSGLDEHGRLLAENYGINIVSGKEPSELQEKTKSLLKQIMKTVEKEKTPEETSQPTEK